MTGEWDKDSEEAQNEQAKMTRRGFGKLTGWSLVNTLLAVGAGGAAGVALTQSGDNDEDRDPQTTEGRTQNQNYQEDTRTEENPGSTTTSPETETDQQYNEQNDGSTSGPANTPAPETNETVEYDIYRNLDEQSIGSFESLFEGINGSDLDIDLESYSTEGSEAGVSYRLSVNGDSQELDHLDSDELQYIIQASEKGELNELFEDIYSPD
jgi:hypothetical protein